MRGKMLKLIVLGVVVIIVAALLMAPDRVVRIAVEKGGSFALGVPVHLKGAALKIFSGKIELRGLSVSNPKGYTTKSAIEIGRIAVHAPLHRLLSSKPRIESITVEAPAVTLEQALTGSNLSDLMNNAGSGKGGGEGKKLFIGSLRIADARVTLATMLKGASSTTINLPLIDIKELGGEGNAGVTIAQTMALALREIVQSAIANGGGVIPADLSASLSSSVTSFNQAYSQMLGARSKVVSEAGSSAGKLLEDAKDTAGKALSGVKQLPLLPGNKSK